MTDDELKRLCLEHGVIVSGGDWAPVTRSSPEYDEVVAMLAESKDYLASLGDADVADRN